MAAPSSARAPIRHVYVHVPFCSGKCTYCSFYSERYDSERVRPYLRALREELSLLTSAGAVLVPTTIYIGGGTPSVLTALELEDLLGVILDFCDVAELDEWTIEANPGTLTDDVLTVLRRSGVNRISLGIQSLSDPVLRDMGRRHSADAVATTMRELRSGGFLNVGGDMIACLPGVGPEQWHATLEQAVALDLSHLSVYLLSVDGDSELARRRQRGDFTPASTEEEIAAMETATAVLRAAGLHRYEISNFARQDRQCRHNVACWMGRDYLGLGPAAASRLGPNRRTNAPDLSGYVQALSAGESPPADATVLSALDDVTERFIFSLRLSRGTRIADFNAPDATREHWTRTLRELSEHGLTRRSGDRWQLTRKGTLLADSVARELIPDTDTGDG